MHKGIFLIVVGKYIPSFGRFNLSFSTEFRHGYRHIGFQFCLPEMANGMCNCVMCKRGAEFVRSTKKYFHFRFIHFHCNIFFAFFPLELFVAPM